MIGMRSQLQLSSSATALPEQLEKLVAGFERMGDEKIRYKQLLFLATKLPPMSDSLKTDTNKVPGCLSTVHVSASYDSSTSTITFLGDSDGLLTKGLVAMLITGLSKCTLKEIQGIDGSFIIRSGLDQSLTPGRNNGFLNMIETMKIKAAQCSAQEESGASEMSENDKPMYNEMIGKLILLKPETLELIDESDQHSGHAGSKGWEESGESHFKLKIVADVFEGMSALKRHQLVYTILGDTMEKIHALSVDAKAPSQVNQ